MRPSLISSKNPKLSPFTTPYRFPRAAGTPPRLDLSWVLVLASFMLELPPSGSPANQCASPPLSPASPPLAQLARSHAPPCPCLLHFWCCCFLGLELFCYLLFCFSILCCRLLCVVAFGLNPNRLGFRLFLILLGFLENWSRSESLWIILLPMVTHHSVPQLSLAAFASYFHISGFFLIPEGVCCLCRLHFSVIKLVLIFLFLVFSIILCHFFDST